MSLFMRHYTKDGGSAPASDKPVDSFQADVQKALDIICDEEMIERAVK